jgi:hypothetical protein
MLLFFGDFSTDLLYGELERNVLSFDFIGDDTAAGSDSIVTEVLDCLLEIGEDVTDTFDDDNKTDLSFNGDDDDDKIDRFFNGDTMLELFFVFIGDPIPELDADNNRL